MQRRSESTQLRRQWSLLRLLSASGRWFTVKQLADQLGCSKSTIDRDLTTLEAVFPLAEEQVGQQKRRYRIDLHIRELDAMQPFGAMQLAALAAALQALHPLAGTGLYDDLLGVAQTVRGALAARHNGGLDRLATAFLPHCRGYVDYASHTDTIDAVVNAVAQRLECRIAYRRAGNEEPLERVIHPMKLLWHDGALYALCRFTPSGCLGKLAIQRIERLETTGTHYTLARGDLARFSRCGFGVQDSDPAPEDVEIRFAKNIAWLIAERVFYPGELKEPMADGTTRYRIRSASQREIVRWVLQFGGDAELVGPASWRADAAHQAQAAATRHCAH